MEYIDTEVVYEENESYDLHSEPHGYKKVGVKIGNRVIWLHGVSWPYCAKESDWAELAKWERIAEKIASALNDK